MNGRRAVRRGSSWLVPATLFLMISYGDARPQQTDRDEAGAGRIRTQALEVSLSELRSQIAALERANRDLARRLDDLGPPAAEPGPRPQMTPQDIRNYERQQFRRDVMMVVGPELARLQDQIAALESRYGSHVHDYMRSKLPGWTTWKSAHELWNDTCPNCLIPFRRNAREANAVSTVQTGGPK